MRKKNPWIIGVIFIASLVCFQGDVTEKAALKIEKSLAQNGLAYYNDSFDKLREEVWEKAGYLYNEEQMANFKQADMYIEDGRLKVETKTGCFSKGGLASKYALRGDFDIQVDCHIDFLEGLYDMDQQLVFLVSDKSFEIKATDSAFIGLFRRGDRDINTIFSGYTKKGKFHRGNWLRIGDFHGTLRITRTGSKISMLYKKEGKRRWKKMNTFNITANDVMLGFKLQNFSSDRTSIAARASITATFDNFRINDVQEIIEAEI